MMYFGYVMKMKSIELNCELELGAGREFKEESSVVGLSNQAHNLSIY